MPEGVRTISASGRPDRADSSAASPHQRVWLLIRPRASRGGAGYVAGAFLRHSAAEAFRATLPLPDRIRAEIRELGLDELRKDPREGERWVG